MPPHRLLSPGGGEGKGEGEPPPLFPRLERLTVSVILD
ncbi:MAG: hypothetical protein OJF52_000021 [Nitrospira sp.]|nr:MAG: hypothetical protein OJF52_000021 [Nitrospira sp.]